MLVNSPLAADHGQTTGREVAVGDREDGAKQEPPRSCVRHGSDFCEPPPVLLGKETGNEMGAQQESK